jgi:hypothetical protein
MTNTNEIVLYQPDTAVRLEVMLGDETVWLTQVQMTELFGTSRRNVSLHINNIIKEGELRPDSTIKDFLIVRREGNREVRRQAYQCCQVLL